MRQHVKHRQQVVNQIRRTTALTSSVNPSTFGQSVTFTATVTSDLERPTGTVTFNDGATVLVQARFPAATASFSTSTLSVGTHAITATYGGSSTFAGSTSNTVNQVVNKAATTTALTSSLNPSIFGQSVTFTAAVTSGAPGTLTGTVHVLTTANVLGSSAVSGGSASFSTAAFQSERIPSPRPTAETRRLPQYVEHCQSGCQHSGDQHITDLVSESSIFGQSSRSRQPSPAQHRNAHRNVTFNDGATVLGTSPLSGGVRLRSARRIVGRNTSHHRDIQRRRHVYRQQHPTPSIRWSTKAATATALTSSVNPSTLGQSVTSPQP